MKKLVYLLIFSLTISSCNNTTKKNTNVAEKATVTNLTPQNAIKVSATTKFTNADTVAIKAVIVKMYQWQDTNNFYYNYMLTEKPNDSIYNGFDMEMLSKRLEELKATSFFSDKFLQQYNSLIVGIDKKLKNGSYKWYVGDLEDDGPGANLWCLCQDVASDNWNDIVITITNQTNTETTVEWDWFEKSANEGYTIKLSNMNNHWLINYMEGFDKKNFRDL